MLGEAGKIEQDDLSLEINAATIAEREKWPADKRNDDPLLFSTHPDFITFPPDGPLRQITIEQMQLVERARAIQAAAWKAARVPDRPDRSRQQRASHQFAAEDAGRAPEHLILLLLAAEVVRHHHPLPGRAFPSGPSPTPRCETFVETLPMLSDPEQRIALRSRTPGLAVSMDLGDVYDERRRAMLALLLKWPADRLLASVEWAKHAEAMAQRRQDKLDHLLGIARAAGRHACCCCGRRRKSAISTFRRQLEDLAGRHILSVDPERGQKER